MSTFHVTGIVTDDDGRPVTAASGMMHIDAVPTESAANAGLETAGNGPAYHCCSLATSIPVAAGADVVANIGMGWTSTASHSFVVNTSLVRP